MTCAVRTALINLQWSRMGGPRSSEDRAMLWIMLLNGWIASYRYIQVETYPPLACLGLAPLSSLLGWYLAKQT
jgi:hypothetical protein